MTFLSQVEIYCRTLRDVYDEANQRLEGFGIADTGEVPEGSLWADLVEEAGQALIMTQVLFVLSVLFRSICFVSSSVLSLF